MALFTVLLEFDGGTYIQQFRATSALNAAAKHAARLISNKAIGKIAARKQLAKQLAADRPTAIEGTRNVWCSFTALGRKTALVNIIATADTRVPKVNE